MKKNIILRTISSFLALAMMLTGTVDAQNAGPGGGYGNGGQGGGGGGYGGGPGNGPGGGGGRGRRNQNSLMPTPVPADSTSVPKAPKPTSVNYAYDETPPDRSNKVRVTSYSDVIEKVVPAVVSVYTTRKVKFPANATPDQIDRMMNQLYGLTPPSQQGPNVVQGPNALQGLGNITNIPGLSPQTGDDDYHIRSVPYGVGSGSIISSDGYILTNHHVVVGETANEAPDTIHVKLHDGREFEAKLVGSDQKTDIALIKIDAKDLPTLKLANSDNLKVGDIVFAVGDPMDVGFTVTQGIVSATGRASLHMLGDEGFENFIQTDASINPGNSGGPLVDAEGRQVGLDSAILSTSRQGGNIGIGFAIPSALARSIIESFIAYGEVRRGFVGVGIQSMDYDLAKGMGLPSTYGALINAVDPALPGGQAGLKRYDVITKVDNDEIQNADDFRFRIASRAPGALAALTVIRDGKTQVINVKLGDRDQLTESVSLPANPRSPAVTPLASSAPLPGITLQPLDGAMRQRFNLPESVQGLVVTGIDSRSPLVDSLRMGDVIKEVGKRPVGTVDDISGLLKPGTVNIFDVFRDGHDVFLSLPLPEQK